MTAAKLPAPFVPLCFQLDARVAASEVGAMLQALTRTDTRADSFSVYFRSLSSCASSGPRADQNGSGPVGHHTNRKIIQLVPIEHWRGTAESAKWEVRAPQRAGAGGTRRSCPRSRWPGRCGGRGRDGGPWRPGPGRPGRAGRGWPAGRRAGRWAGPWRRAPAGPRGLRMSQQCPQGPSNGGGVGVSNKNRGSGAGAATGPVRRKGRSRRADRSHIPYFHCIVPWPALCVCVRTCVLPYCSS